MCKNHGAMPRIVWLFAFLTWACGHHGGVKASDAPTGGDANVDAGPPVITLVLLGTASNASAVGLVSTLNEQSIADPYPAVPMFSRLAPDVRDPPVYTNTVGPLDSIVWQAPIASASPTR